MEKIVYLDSTLNITLADEIFLGIKATINDFLETGKTSMNSLLKFDCEDTLKYLYFTLIFPACQNWITYRRRPKANSPTVRRVYIGYLVVIVLE